jgi:hypothetical protein
MVIPTVGALQWSTVEGAFRSTITGHRGVVPPGDVVTPLATTYLWPWTNTSMSLLLRSSTGDAIVTNSDPINPFAVAAAGSQIPPRYRWDG